MKVLIVLTVYIVIICPLAVLTLFGTALLKRETSSVSRLMKIGVVHHQAVHVEMKTAFVHQQAVDVDHVAGVLQPSDHCEQRF